MVGALSQGYINMAMNSMDRPPILSDRPTIIVWPSCLCEGRQTVRRKSFKKPIQCSKTDRGHKEVESKIEQQKDSTNIKIPTSPKFRAPISANCWLLVRIL